MINSTKKQLALSGWLKNNHIEEYQSLLKLQKFLLFYELFAKMSGETVDFSHLRGYKCGPVFSNVWGDYTKKSSNFGQAADKEFLKNVALVNEIRAKKCAFIVSVLSENELSELTHTLNLWSAKKERILSSEYQVTLDEEYFSLEDVAIMKSLDSMYPIDLIDNSIILHIDSFSFVFQREDFANLTEEMLDTLSELVEKQELHNPTYVTIEDGEFVFD